MDAIIELIEKQRKEKPTQNAIETAKKIWKTKEDLLASLTPNKNKNKAG